MSLRPSVLARLAGLTLAALGVNACFAFGPDPKSQKLSQSEQDIAADMLKKGQVRGALDHALKATELDGSNYDASYLASFIYLQLCATGQKGAASEPRDGEGDCRLGEAERFARRALEAKPDFREARNTLGVILVHRKKLNEAIQVLKPLTEDILYRSPALAWGNLGWAHLELAKQGGSGRASELGAALEALEQAVAAEPRFCVGHLRLGDAHVLRKAYAQAAKAYTRALAVEDDNCRSLQGAYLGRAQAELALKQNEEAAADLKRCLELGPTTATGRACRNLANSRN